MITNFNLGIIPDTGKIVVGLSGGADSMAVLHNLLLCVGKARIVACHFNHKWNEQETADAKWVESYCANLDIQFELGVNETSNKTETGARQMRYDFFKAVCNAQEAACIALGHHLDDQCETVLYRLARGTGVDGLAGIPTVRDLTPTCNVIRPLLRIPKDEIVAWCEEQGLKWITDMTNFDTDKCRNLIRLEVMPRMLKMNPTAKRAIGRLATLAEQDCYLLNIMIQEKINELRYEEHEAGWSIDASEFSNLDSVLRDRIWHKLDKGPMSSKRIATVNDSIRTKVPCDLKGGWHLSFEDKRINMTHKLTKANLVPTDPAPTVIGNISTLMAQWNACK